MKILAKKDGACIKRVPKNRWGWQKRVARKWWGWQKSGGKKKVIVSFLIWFATARTFLPAFFFHPHRFLATSFFATPPLFCTLPFYRHYFFVTSFLLPVFSGKVFLEATAAAAATKFFLGWRKRGGRKEVTKKRWCRGDGGKGGGGKGMGG